MRVGIRLALNLDTLTRSYDNGKQKECQIASEFQGPKRQEIFNELGDAVALKLLRIRQPVSSGLLELPGLFSKLGLG